ncbi:hypothetical protein B0O80DRAFT_296130 [Mortierella sp. GBAus27b]|nr:hypothetical protein B0O80DRAFT_296130 [Mortierella sp. GBAus27b]
MKQTIKHLTILCIWLLLLVAVNDGGGDEASAKPRTQPEVAIETTLAQPQAEESDLQQYEANGNVQPCHKCNSNPTRDQRMISCDFCPLHWHQSCLSPSMAPPSSGRHTWKCPSHADHTPRRSKRKGASPILAEYPNGSDNGSSDVVSDRDSPPQKREMLDADDRVLFRIPEQNIKLSFIDKCQKIRESKAGNQRIDSVFPSARTQQPSDWGFNLLVAVAMASELGSESTCLVRPGHQEQEPSWCDPQEILQDAVLHRLTEPTERQEYLRFRAFQRHIREHDAEDALKQWLDNQQAEREHIATQGLLNL